MKDILTKLKLKDNFTIVLDMSRTEFIEKLSAITDEGDTDVLLETFDVFSSSKNALKGRIDLNGFDIKRRKRPFDSNMNMATARGIIKENQGHLTIETEINGYNTILILLFFIAIIIYLTFFFNLLIDNNNIDLYSSSYFLIQTTFIFAIPYFMIRRSVKRLKNELEKAFSDLKKINKST